MDQKQPGKRSKGRSRGLCQSTQQTRESQPSENPQQMPESRSTQGPQQIQSFPQRMPRLPQQMQVRPSQQMQVRPSQQMQIRPSQQMQVRPSQQMQVRPSQQIQVRPSQQIKVRPSQQVQPRSQGGVGVQKQPTGKASTSQVEQVTAAMKTMTTAPDMVPLGRGAIRGRIPISTNESPTPELSKKQGQMGQPILLTANYFPITSYTNWCLYQYKVKFNPEENNISVKRGLLANHKNVLGPYIFDGDLMFSSTKYHSNTFELTSKRTLDDKLINISVEFVHVIETNADENVQVFNLLIRNCFRHLNLKLVGRNYYDVDARIQIPMHRLELWPGYETSVRLHDNGLLLRSEITTKVMRMETVLDFYKECLTDRNSSNDYMTKFKIGVIGTTVLTRYNNKTYQIDDVDDRSDINSTFKKKDGTTMSYKDYYEQRWRCSITFKKQPLLISKKKRSFVLNNTSKEEELVYLIPEFCSLTGLSDSMRNNFKLMRDLAIHTQVYPDNRIKKYYDFINRLHSKPECLETFNNWNLTLGNNLINVPARVLPMENIGCNVKEYNGGPTAEWTHHLKFLPMYTSVVMKHWVLLIPKEVEHDINSFVTNLQKVGNGMSFSLPQPQILFVNGPYLKDYILSLERVINQINPAFILCVISGNRGDYYNSIKRKLCVDRAIPSQVVLMKNVKKINMAILTKIAIQINCKMGGAPWFIKIPIQKMMIIGFDVCHDNQNKNNSYGAFVASLNDSHTSYFSCVMSHNKGEELSPYFCSSIVKALEKYRFKNGVLPDSIVIYRDGVGDGQLQHVRAVEISVIQETLQKYYKNPHFAFIIVKKRIGTRLFASTSNQQKKYGNPPPGTVVDQVITDPKMYDFFLVSQNVNVGTVSPTHYNVIEDTLTNWSPDKMQRLTYKLTHMYYNWSGTIRVPAHCQLAHKLAFFVSQSLKTSPNIGLDELLYFL